jgi:YidC/Oxa1 family membrane protein insertase
MNKTDKIVVVALFILLGLWFFYMNSTRPKPPEAAAIPVQPTLPVTPATPGAEPGLKPTPTPAETPAATPVPPSPTGEFADLAPAAPVTLRTADGALVTIDPERGGITQVELPAYKATKGAAENVVIGREADPMLGLQSRGGDLAFSHAKVLEETPTSLKIVRQLAGRGVLVEQEWRLTAAYARLDYVLTLRNAGTNAAKLKDLELAAGFMPPLDMPAGFFGAGGIDQQLQYLPAGTTSTDYQTVPGLYKMSPEKADKLGQTPMTWVAAENKFFTTVLDSADGFSGCGFRVPAVKPEKDGKSDARFLLGFARLPDQVLAAGESQSLRFDFYAGPKLFDRLQAMGKRKEQIMQFGLFLFWQFPPMEWISRGINWVILALLGWVGNYGIAIILTTLIIRGVFWPVTHASMVWSERMKALQPHMQALREKFKSDPQVFNQKVMELYREHKVNPFAGCLPLLFQIPVFFALFNVLRNAIAARHAGFLWVADLSLPDTLFSLPAVLPFIGGAGFNILPLMMGGSMLVQQKLMPTSADPAQEKMMLFMCVFMIVICYSMPAGLTLYWTVSNVFTIGQYQVIHAMMGRGKAKPSQPTNTGKKKS